MYAHFGMDLDDLFDDIGQSVCFSTSRIAEQTSGIVNGGKRILQTLEIDTRLSVGKRGRLTIDH